MILAVIGVVLLLGGLGHSAGVMPILPVLFARATLIFRLPAMIDLAVSLFILARAL